MFPRFNSISASRALTAIILTTFTSLPAAAETYRDSRVERFASDGQISANEAKRIVRGFLTEKGFSSQIRPGGARVGKVALEGGLWVVRVTLYGDALASHTERSVYIGTRSGLLADNRIEAGALLAAIAEHD